MESSHFVQTISTIVLALASIILVIATFQLAFSTKKYLKETEKMREIMAEELKSRIKPVVGVNAIQMLYVVKDKNNIGKKIVWNRKENKFYIDNSPCEILGINFNILIKNFSSEPATKLDLDTELWIDNTVMPKTVSPDRNKIIMPTQTLTNSVSITKTTLISALKENKIILLKIKILYSDLSEIENIFEYYLEAEYNGNSIINKTSYFRDKR